jgi:hypothetical protein
MVVHNIDLTEFIPKGQVVCEYKDKLLSLKTNRAIPTQRFDAEHLSINSYIHLPQKYKLPLRIDVRAKIDAPGFYVLFGKGHINFGTMCSDNRRIDDIVAPTRKPINFHNSIALNEFVDISILYDLKEMQILINNEERYYSKKEKYMKSPAFPEMNKEGFELKLACDKLSELWIQSVSITEDQDSCNICHAEGELPAAITKNEAITSGEKVTFEHYISRLPQEIHDEIVKLDVYLKSLKILKFKRQLEKNGNKITYVASDYGVSYAIYLSNDRFDHSLQWYLITNGKAETWHRKADCMEAILDRLDQKEPEVANRLFYSLEDCVGCYKDCLARTKYRFHEKQKTACHGKLKFRMNLDGFDDVRIIINEINLLAQESI